MLPVMRWLEYQSQLPDQASKPLVPIITMKSHSSELNDIQGSPAKEESNLLNNS